MNQVILAAQNIKVQYRVPHRRFGSFKEYMLSKLKGENHGFKEFVALDNVSIEAKRGECIGLIGHNGSGKSTLLKVIAGILRAKEGAVNYTGRLASLIELGAGFDSELTAKDNIYLACTLMGVKRKEIDSSVEEIIRFAELENFIDFPLKNYSSGMYARLGFACATVINPDILLIDEVLAVGDESFQIKCLNRIRELKSQGKSIIIVTHSMGVVEEFCERVYVLDHGQLVYEGEPRGGVIKYREMQNINH